MIDFGDALDGLARQHLRRELTVLEGRRGRLVELEGRALVNFAGNDYLGLSVHPEVIAEASRALATYGLGAGASRLMSGTYQAHRELEDDLARLKRTEAALVFSSGYLANLAVLGTLPEGGDLLMLDRNCHASLVDAARLSKATLRVFPHNDLSELAKRLTRRTGGRTFIVTEGVFSMDGDLAPVGELAALARRTGSWLVLDDAHGIGCFGPSGAGVLEHAGVRPDGHTVVIGTLSKAVGAVGGFVAASAEVRDWLVNRARPFIYTTALPPALCAGARKSVELLRVGRDLRRQLWRNVTHLRRALSGLGLELGQSASQIIPIIVGEPDRAVALAARCREAGLLVPAIRPPTVRAGSSRLRVSVTALHQPEDLDRLVSTLTD